MLKNQFQRRLIYLMLVAIFAIALTACGTKTNSATNSNSSTGQDVNKAGNKGASNAAPNTDAGSDSNAETVVYKDKLGEKKIPAHPKAVFTDQYLFQMLSLDSVPIGAVSYQVEDIMAIETNKISNVTNVGSPVNMEMVLALQPDLIITANEDSVAQYEQIAPTVLLPWTSYDAFGQVEQIGILLGKEKEAKAWIEDFHKKEAEAKAQVAKMPGANETYSIFAIMGKDQFRVYGGRNIGHVFYRSLGLHAPADVEKLFKGKEDEFVFETISQEALPQLAGDNIIIVVYDTDADSIASYNQLMESKLWKNIPAVQKGKFVRLDMDHWFGYNSLSLSYQLDKALGVVQELQK
ncbi:iron complex transport system substrate-binding protein [Paenibacillus turicensis]|uniref:Iron complex transport system substrate-binding protein n=1 Tax=Paenibacillus turicensis TaxID=160487 RepID=A0ABS4FRZ1_9BACL|nr:ABC transporter substrate-binding protein [Paenibacillus turicensis]MBP1905351.1 iron complex transport system substrate-binding protein [Paenibacillus turicensis]